jgi:hypothetical protein
LKTTQKGVQLVPAIAPRTRPQNKRILKSKPQTCKYPELAGRCIVEGRYRQKAPNAIDPKDPKNIFDTRTRLYIWCSPKGLKGITFIKI